MSGDCRIGTARVALKCSIITGAVSALLEFFVIYDNLLTGRGSCKRASSSHNGDYGTSPSTFYGSVSKRYNFQERPIQFA